MFDTPPIIRTARADDLPKIQAIYAHYVGTSLSSFEIAPPDVAEMTKRFETIQARGFPYLVAEVEGMVAGYAYAGTYRARAAYDYTVEDSVYVSPAHLRRGLGHALLKALIEACSKAGYRRMVAVIGDSANTGSINLHRALGFTDAGVLPSAGFKFGRWIDSVRMQRPLGEGDTTPPGPIRV
jgi:L-amino acid N-acyltransferase YncA